MKETPLVFKLVKYLLILILLTFLIAAMAWFLRNDLLPSLTHPPSGSRSIAIQAISAVLTTFATLVLLYINFRSENRSQRAEATTIITLQKTDELVRATVHMAAATQEQAESLLLQNKYLRESNAMKIRYNLLPIISRDARGEFDELHIVNISSSMLVIADIRRDDKDFNDYVFGIENTLASGNYSYKLLKPGESLIILKKGEIIARPGDTYRFDIGIYYGLAGDSRQNVSFKIVFGSSETASISNYSDTNPSRPVEKFTEESEGIYKRSVDSGNPKE